MKNRALLLCILNRIETVEEYARLVGITADEAIDILNERTAIPADVIKRNCQLFNVSVGYFLCICESSVS